MRPKGVITMRLELQEGIDGDTFAYTLLHTLDMLPYVRTITEAAWKEDE